MAGELRRPRAVKTKPRSEKAIEQAIRRRLEDMGYKAIKLAAGPFQVVGLPDLLVLGSQGNAGFIEVKRFGERPTILQASFLEGARLRGFPAVVMWSEDEVPSFVAALVCGEISRVRGS